jgi:integrase
VKAQRLASYLASLIGPPQPVRWLPLGADPSALDGSCGANRATGGIGIEAANDHEAIDAWIGARSGSAATARQYRREAERFVLWIVVERRRALSDASVEDCSAYLAFLADVPARWITRRKVRRFETGWAPFRSGSLSVASRKLAVAALHSLFGWLVKVRYLVLNPWDAINRKLGDDPRAELDVDPSRAFTPEAWKALRAQIGREPEGRSRDRLEWLLVFAEATGLRASELLAARRSHLLERRNAWFVRVHGKGRKNRLVPIPSAAMRATRGYLASRGLDWETVPADTPLVATLNGEPLSYSAIHETFTRFVRRALRASSLGLDERRQAEAASMHWLRHTHATRAAERDVPLDVLQANLGQADPRTTSRYYRAQIERRQAAMERAFGMREGA